MGGKTEKKVTVQETDLLKIQELSYEDTLQVLAQKQSSQGLSQQTSAGQSSNTQNGKSGFNPVAVAVGTVLGGIGGALLGGLFGERSWKTTTDVDDSGYQYVKDWFATKWDRGRYALGIKELGVHSNEYTEASDLVSVEYSVPGTVRKISLLVDQKIPSALKDLDPVRPWILYYVSVDDGETWLPIAPQSDVPTVDQSGTQIPIIYNVNDPLPADQRIFTQGYVDTEEDIKRVRFRARLERPAGDEFKQYTPVLNKYELRLLTGRRAI